MTNAKHAGLLIPVDGSPIKAVNIIDRSTIDGLLGDYAERAQYDHGAAMYVRHNGINEGQPRNARATEYILNHSDSAKQGRMEGVEDSYALYGPVVITGTDADGEILQLPERQFDYFMAPEVAKLSEEIAPEVEFIEEFEEPERFVQGFDQ